jgi:hypothetical protein
LYGPPENFSDNTLPQSLELDDWPDATIAFYDEFYYTFGIGDPSSVVIAELHTITAVSPLTVPGDFNGNSFVDAADYAVWRKGLGTTYTQADYDLWRAHFGQTAASASAKPAGSAASAVPEPRMFCLAALALIPFVIRIRTRRSIKLFSTLVVVVASIFLMGANTARAQEPFFIGLGIATDPEDISGDGSVIVGDNSDLSFRWTRETGLMPIVELYGSESVSADGSTVAINSGFRWTSDAGLVQVPLGPTAVSADGRILVGSGRNPATGQSQAARWTQSNGMEFVPLSATDSKSSAAWDVSSDGSVIVGTTFNGSLLPGAKPMASSC